MTREEVYKENTIMAFDNYKRVYIPEHMIDAIIDCAVEEAVERMKKGVKNDKRKRVV